MNQDVNENRKRLWKEVSKANGGKVENCNRIKYRNGRLALGYDEVRRIWKDCFEDLYNIDTQEQIPVNICGFGGIQRSKHFGIEPIGKIKVKVRVRTLKNRKVAGKDEVTGEMIIGGGDMVVSGIWKMCNMAFESGVVSED